MTILSAGPGEKRCLECHFKTREKATVVFVVISRNPARQCAPANVSGKISFFPIKNMRNLNAAVANAVSPNGKPRWAHDQRADGRLPGLSQRQRCPENCVMCHNQTPYPADHTGNYEKKHGLAYRSDPQRCRMCHEDSSCVECHSRKPKTIPLPGFVTAMVWRRKPTRRSVRPVILTHMSAGAATLTGEVVHNFKQREYHVTDGFL